MSLALARESCRQGRGQQALRYRRRSDGRRHHGRRGQGHAVRCMPGRARRRALGLRRASWARVRRVAIHTFGLAPGRVSTLVRFPTFSVSRKEGGGLGRHWVLCNRKDTLQSFCLRGCFSRCEEGTRIK